ncbi:fibroblast growth factor (acidic) intracellular binding protein a isoform X1 [Heptranchias perlo]|uniref:fibroblast growth factor (acidic) intracellular binding protein a isoform X1 n=1 Tax=Heptranchias perlo TaxID=212740 RepID=UPI0035593C13
MAVELDVFVGNTTLIDKDVYQLWLDGYSVSDAVTIRIQSGILEQTGATPDVLESDTMDHYRTFQMLERLLHSPPKLINQLLFQIPPPMQSMLIEKYYAFDEPFVREVLGKKLSKGTKKDLDDVSTKTGITLKSCRRQFDNFKRVFKVVEEMKGPLVENIQQNFLLSDRLAGDYAAVVFFANSRFETGKKRLQYLTFEDFACCAEQLIQNWTLGAVENRTPAANLGPASSTSQIDHAQYPGANVKRTSGRSYCQSPDSMVDDMDVDLDREFLQDLKDLKVLVTDKDLLDQHKSLVCTALRGKVSTFNEMETSFKTLSRGLINIAAKLIHTKDVRDLFIDLVEKFIEPCKSDRWSTNDVCLFLTQYTNTARALDAFKHQCLWERYMGTIKSCIMKMYHD